MSMNEGDLPINFSDKDFEDLLKFAAQSDQLKAQAKERQAPAQNRSGFTLEEDRLESALDPKKRKFYLNRWSQFEYEFKISPDTAQLSWRRAEMEFEEGALEALAFLQIPHDMVWDKENERISYSMKLYAVAQLMYDHEKSSERFKLNSDPDYRKYIRAISLSEIPSIKQVSYDVNPPSGISYQLAIENGPPYESHPGMRLTLPTTRAWSETLGRKIMSLHTDARNADPDFIKAQGVLLSRELNRIRIG